MPKPTRLYALSIAALVVLAVGFALVPVRGETIHRFAFGGKYTVLVRGDANVKVEEKEHDISDQSFKSQPSSEHLKLTADVAVGDSAFIHYHYDTPPAPVSAALTAGVWVKATKTGAQLRARVVLPKEPDPARPESPLTMLIVGDTYDKGRAWQKLTLTDVPALIGKHLPVLQAKIGRAVNTNGAYIDRLVLNLYTGPGTADIWIDDIDIGPVKPADTNTGGATPGTPAKQPKNTDSPGPRGRIAKQEGGQLFVDGKPYFFRAVRHTGAPLHVLRQAGFDALWVPADVPNEVIEEANREGWLLVPAAPLAPARTESDKAATVAAEAALDSYYRKFANGDILFWDMGGGRLAEQVDAVERTTRYIRKNDSKRPFSADVWDGFTPYSSFLDAVGAHRWPLFTSLDFDRYQLWLEQRYKLTSGRAVFWTWVQNHAPDWYLANLGQKDTDKLSEPSGPQPEQVRLLAYISVGCGCRGLGFWSDRFLADTHHGRDRLQGMAILNAELEMLAPVLLAPLRERPQWIETSNPNVKAALLRGSRGTVLLPIWFGKHGQFVPEQGAAASITVTVPLVMDGADPWRISPAGVECLRNNTRKVTGGTELTINEFDLVAPIVFTNDQTQNGLLVWWQDYNRKYGRLAARWAMDLAAEEYEKTYAVHARLAQMNVQIRDAEKLFQQAVNFHESARRNFAAELYQQAFTDANRALRPLRVIMRDHWNKATATLDTPTASPFAVSYFSLPKHWELFREVQASQPASSVLPNGNFEPANAIPPEGLTVNALPGWNARFGSLPVDRVDVAAGIVSSAKLEDKVEPKKIVETGPKIYRASRPIPAADEGYVPPQPEFGKGVLKLEVRNREEKLANGKVVTNTNPLERTFLAVESQPVRLPPGTLVRVSGWIKIPDDIQRTADGVLFYDDAGGEPLAVRLLSTKGLWKQYHLYRRVPASGQISLTLALTGVGVAYFDEMRIEPLVPATRK